MSAPDETRHGDAGMEALLRTALHAQAVPPLSADDLLQSARTKVRHARQRRTAVGAVATVAMLGLGSSVVAMQPWDRTDDAAAAQGAPTAGQSLPKVPPATSAPQQPKDPDTKPLTSADLPPEASLPLHLRYHTTYRHLPPAKPTSNRPAISTIANCVPEGVARPIEAIYGHAVDGPQIQTELDLTIARYPSKAAAQHALDEFLAASARCGDNQVEQVRVTTDGTRMVRGRFVYGSQSPYGFAPQPAYFLVVGDRVYSASSEDGVGPDAPDRMPLARAGIELLQEAAMNPPATQQVAVRK